MIEELEKHIIEAQKRLDAGAALEKLLEEYTTKLELKDAFYILSQAQIRKMKNKK